MSREEVVYYREIQKNAYLKRVTDEGGGRLRPLAQKRAPLKAMWTVFCVHNGKTPYLEQYSSQEDPATTAHRPAWRASLERARHVTASVRPWPGGGYDFFVAAREENVRMLAPDWDTMQDWVNVLRNKLAELKVLEKGENVYGAPPAPPPQRAGTRDPTSPLPPTPVGPAIRVPGIEPVVAPSRANVQDPREATAESPIVVSEQAAGVVTAAESADGERLESEDPAEALEPVEETRRSLERLDWSQAIQLASQPPASQESTSNLVNGSSGGMKAPSKIAKICGQNVCLDDSVLKNRPDEEYSDGDCRVGTDGVNTARAGEFVEDDQFLLENECGEETLKFDERIDSYKVEAAPSCQNVGERHKQRLVITEEINDETPSTSSNVTVIQVSNVKNPPHTAIPVMTQENVFDFDFKQRVQVNDRAGFVNIVNTENGYGTIFKDDGPKMTTTVKLCGGDEGIYEKLCMASTSSEAAPQAQAKNKPPGKPQTASARKASLPNLQASDPEPTYEYLFPIGDTASRNGGQSNDIGGRSNGNGGRSNGNANGQSDRGESRPRTTFLANVTNTLSDARREYDGSQCRVIDAGTLSSRWNAPDRNRISSPRRDGGGSSKSDKSQEMKPSKGLFKRGLTELSFLSRLKTLGQNSAKPRENTQNDTPVSRVVASPVKVVRRSRPEARPADASRRRSSSLTGAAERPTCEPLRVRQAAALRAEQARGAAVAARISRADAEREPPVFCDASGHVWVAWWGRGGAWHGGRAGDRVAAVRGCRPRDAAHARHLLKQAISAGASHSVDIHFHRVPLAKIYILYKEKDDESIGVKLDGECGVARVEAGSAAARAGLSPSAPRWAVTEVNNRPMNLLKNGDEQLRRLSGRCEEVSLLLQPLSLVQKLRSALKSHRVLHVVSGLGV